nr:TIM barrel protein [Kineococcus vitellinus]
MLTDTQQLGGEVFQICDHPDLEDLTDERARALRRAAAGHGTVLETGTRGIGVEHLLRHLQHARALGARTVRSMVFTADDRPTPADAEVRLRAVLPAYEGAGVVLGLETYEQISTGDLLALVDRIDSPHLGIVLDPANCVAGLEHPREVVRRLAHRVVNIHVKDFRFTRREGWAGFTLASCPLGEGQLDYADLLEVVRPDPGRVHQVLEHWLPPQGSGEEGAASTRAVEAQWTRRSLAVLARLQSHGTIQQPVDQ